MKRSWLWFLALVLGAGFVGYACSSDSANTLGIPNAEFTCGGSACVK